MLSLQMASKLTLTRSRLSPVDIKELQSFIGLGNYYRRFISGFSIVEEPLYELSRKVVSFQRQMEQESAFNELRLAYPDFFPDAIIRT